MVAPQRPTGCVGHAEIAVGAARRLGTAVADFFGEVGIRDDRAGQGDIIHIALFDGVVNGPGHGHATSGCADP